MAQRVRDILLRVTGDASDAEQVLQRLAHQLGRLDGTTVSAKVDIDATLAERKLKHFKDQLDKLNKHCIKIDCVKIDASRILGSISRVLVGLLGTIGKTIMSGFSGLFSLFSGGFSIVTTLGGSFLKLGVSLAALGPALLLVIPLVLVLIPAMIGAAGAAVFLAGALAALVVSLAHAVAGVGVLAVALAAALGPVILVVMAAMARFAKILEAVKQSEDDAARASERNAQNAERVKAATERVTAAHRAQADAQRNAVDAAARVRTTAVDAYRAWAAAAEDARDAIRGITQAELSRDQAKLNTKRAVQELRNLRKEAGQTGEEFDDVFEKFTNVNADASGLASAVRAAGGTPGTAGTGPSSLDIQQAVLNVRKAKADEADAIDGVGDAHTRANEARTRELEFIEKGIQAYEPYTAAVKAAADAQRAVADAAEASADAEADAAKAITDSRKKQADATKGLTAQEKRLVEVLIDLKEAITDLFAPATKRIFEGVLNLLEDLADFAKDPAVKRGFTAIGDAIGDMFTDLGKLFRSREMRTAFVGFARAGAAIIRELGPALRPFARAVTRLADEAMPWLLTGIRRIGRAIRGWLEDTSKSGIERFVQRVRDSFNAWRRVAQRVWDVIVAIWKKVQEVFPDIKTHGDNVADSIADILEKLREWIDDIDPEKVKAFFREVKKSADDTLESIQTIADAIKAISSGWDAFKASTGGEGPGAGETGGVDVFKRKPWWQQLLGRQAGGVVPGAGSGDIVPAMLEPGEFVIRRSVAQAIGIPRLNRLNAGRVQGLRAGGVVIQQQDVHLPAAPGHDQLGDARHQAVMFAREMARRGGTPVHR